MGVYLPKHDRSAFVLWRWRDIYTPGSDQLYLNEPEVI